MQPTTVTIHALLGSSSQPPLLIGLLFCFADLPSYPFALRKVARARSASHEGLCAGVTTAGPKEHSVVCSKVTLLGCFFN